jgi:hypothetical protein
MIKIEIDRIVAIGNEEKCEKAFKCFLGMDEYAREDKYSRKPVEVKSENCAITVIWQNRHGEKDVRTYKTWVEALGDRPPFRLHLGDDYDKVLGELKAIQ